VNATDWAAYYATTEGRPPRRTLLTALAKREAEGLPPGIAVDLGAGGGRDTVALLRRGWRVLAIDPAPEAAEALRALPGAERLEVVTATMEDAAWPAADLINASFCLPKVAPDRFDRFWARLAASLAPAGRLAGQLYGDRDSWAGSGLTIHSEAQARARLDGLTVELFEVEEEDSVTPRGEAKHWHIFHMVARKG